MLRGAALALLMSAVATIACASGHPVSPAQRGECDAPRTEWIFCDDFEQNRIPRYFEADNSGAFTRVAGVGHENSWGMRARFAAGTVTAGSLKIAFGKTPQGYFRPVDAGTATYRDVYWRIYLRNAAGWTGGGGDKLSRITVFASSTSWAQAMVGHVWSGGPGGNILALDPASGTDEAGALRATTYNDFERFRWLGAVGGSLTLFDAAHVGQWYCIENRVRLNDPGQANGVFEMWINGALDARKTGINWVGSFNAFGLNAILIENYWNNGSPAAQERYMDRFVVSSARIGC
jgi:hypothetical protein